MIEQIRFGRVMALVCVAAWSASGMAQDADEPSSRLHDGTYLAPMASGIFPLGHHAPLKDGYGGTLALGWRSGWYAVEIAPLYADLKHAKPLGAAVNGLLFPFRSVPNLYATVGVAGIDYRDFETPTNKEEFNTVNVNGGLGYILPFRAGRYDFGLRAEVLYRYGERERKYNDLDVDIDAPRHFKQVVANVGLHLPLGLRPEPPPVAPPVAVVAPAAICSDTLDNDGDGLIDFPGDPGCSAADDSDESDPPQCSNGKDDDGDGLVDFPADRGCTAADDVDETDPCRTPAPGERVSLKGCATGDTIVLRGVNFEFDKSTLTANAKTILDNVAEELAAYPDIKVEVGGHTDARGSDEYNQKLSDRRAAAVLKYLAGKGVATDRMTSAGYGEAKPVADNETDEGRELNRRVELRITQ